MKTGKKLKNILLITCICLLYLTACSAKNNVSTGDEESVTNNDTNNEQSEDLHSESKLGETADELAKTLTSNYGVSAIQYAIIENGTIILSSQKGDTISKDTVFGIASVSKMYTATAAMILVDQGKIDLDTPLTNYIPSFKMADERYKKITARMLLNHSSGLYGSHYLGGTTFHEASSWSKDNLLGLLEKENLKADPGAFSVYCNDGYQLLEIMIEQVSGMAYHEFLSTYITEPLNLNKTTTAFSTSFDTSNMARLGILGSEDYMPIEMVNVTGTGGVYSTAEEVCKFSEVLSGNQPDILSKESALAMQKQEYRNGLWISDTQNDTGYGFGWDNVDSYTFSQYGIKALVKGGDVTTFHADLTVLPEKGVSVAVLSTGGSSIYNTLMSKKLLEQYLLEKGLIEQLPEEETFETPVKAEMPDEMTKYSGFYGTGTFYGARTAEITIKDGTLTISEGMGGMVPEQQFVYTENGEFKREDGKQIVSFIEEKNGETYLSSKNFIELPGLGTYLLNGHQFQRIEPITLEKEIADVWNLRKDTKYLYVNALPNETSYMEPFLMIYRPIIDTENGYADNCKIVDEDNAVNIVQIPVMDGRDSFDLRYFKEDNVNYLQKADMIFISEADITGLSANQSECVIADNGYAQWFAIDSDSKEKNLKVEMPEGASFSVYNNEQNCIYTSVMGVEADVLLPAEGYVVFSGARGDAFAWTLQ